MERKGKYDDIIMLQYPFADGRKMTKRMTLADRAKIFSPFAALKGHEEAILAKQTIVVPKIELSEEAKEVLDRKMLHLQKSLEQKEHPMITVVYFQPQLQDEDGNGQYRKVTGMAVRLFTEARTLQIVGHKILLDHICDMSGDIFGVLDE